MFLITIAQLRLIGVARGGRGLQPPLDLPLKYCCSIVVSMCSWWCKDIYLVIVVTQAEDEDEVEQLNSPKTTLFRELIKRMPSVSPTKWFRIGIASLLFSILDVATEALDRCIERAHVGGRKVEVTMNYRHLHCKWVNVLKWQVSQHIHPYVAGSPPVILSFYDRNLSKTVLWILWKPLAIM